MTDEELREWLNLTPEEAAAIIPKIRPEARKVYEDLKVAYDQIRLWEQGKGPLPSGVMVD